MRKLAELPAWERLIEKRTGFIIVIVSVFLSVLLMGCNAESFTYEFRQDGENIERVEISTYDHNTKKLTTITSLSKDEIAILLEDIKVLECYEFLPLDPILSYGDVVICITYYNGEREVLGITNIGSISPEGNWTTTRKYFNIEDICDVIGKFADTEVLSEVSDYF